MNMRLHKSTKDRMISGVCGGIGEYFNIDSSIIRILWAVAVFAYGAGLLLYIIAAIILPEGDYDEEYSTEGNGQSDEILKDNSRRTFGIILIVLGIFLLLKRFTPYLDSKYIWPIIIIIIGVFIIIKGGKNNNEEQ